MLSLIFLDLISNNPTNVETVLFSVAFFDIIPNSNNSVKLLPKMLFFIIKFCTYFHILPQSLLNMHNRLSQTTRRISDKSKIVVYNKSAMYRSKEYIATLFSYSSPMLLYCSYFRNNNMFKCRIFLH